MRFRYAFERTNDIRKIFFFAIFAIWKTRATHQIFRTSFLSLSFSFLSLSFSLPWAKCHNRVLIEFRVELEELVEGSHLKKKRRSRREGREKPVFKWASVIVSRGRGINVCWRMCTGVWLLWGRRMMPLHSYPSIWGKKCFAQKRNIFWQLSSYYYLLRVIITRRRKFYIVYGIK